MADTTRMETGGTFSALGPGTRLDNRYTIRSVIAAGGFGITYMAEHDGLGRIVAIKEHFPRNFAIREGATATVRPTDPVTFKWALDRFLDEGRALARSKHPNVVDVTDVFEQNATAYIVLGYEDGQSLGHWARSLGRPPTQRELDDLLRPLLDALASVHRQGLLHRDIAPDNIMVRRDGSPCLIDFGAARQAIAQRSVIMSAIVKGGYSPPEQYTTSAKAQGPWSDIYALGATLYRIITGKTPPEATERVLEDELGPLSETVPDARAYRPEFLAGIDHALRIKHYERPQSVVEWRESLFGHAEPAPQPAPPSRPIESTRKGPTVIVPRPQDRDESETRIAGSPIPPPPADSPAWVTRGLIAFACLMMVVSVTLVARPTLFTAGVDRQAIERERAAIEAQRRQLEAERLVAMEAEAQRKADEERRIAIEAEARRQADDERRQREEIAARQKADEDARLAAEEDARRKAEEEKRLAAEAEVKRKAEDARKAAVAAAAAAAAKKAAVEEQQRRASAQEQQRRQATAESARESQQRQRQQNSQSNSGSGSSCGAWRACRALYSTQPGTACGSRPSGC